jgi:hypothetical protein
MSALSYRGTVHFLKGVDAAMLPGHLAHALRHMRANAVEVNTNRVSFKALGSGLSFGSGVLVVDAATGQLEYGLDFRRLLIVVTAIMLAAAAVVLELLDSDPLSVLRWFPVAWFLLVYGALVVGVAQFRGLLRRAIADAPRSSYSLSPANDAVVDKRKINAEKLEEQKRADVSVLLGNELRRLQNGRSADDKPSGTRIARLCVTCSTDPLEAVLGAKEVLKALDRAALAGWPQAQISPSFPAWFIAACAPESSRQDAEQWVAWWSKLSEKEKIKAEEEKDWSLESWLYWMEPQNREWFWWDAQVETNPDRIILQLEVTAWPFSWGALRWLLRTAGASGVELQAA